MLHADTVFVIQNNPGFVQVRQCSPYQAVTGKIYRLKQHFLPPAAAKRFTKIK